MADLWKWVQLGLIGVIMAAAVTVHASAERYNGYELPPYQVERADGATEIRLYRPHVVAEVTVTGERSGAIGRGFRVLADFIFGNNDGGEKVAMTVPVTQKPDAAGQWIVQFMMPSEYTLDSLPRPNNDAVRFRETAEERHAVIRFSGRGTTAKLETQTEALRDWIGAQGLTEAGAPRYHFYNDPFTLPWKRRNEVSIPLGTSS